MFCYIQSHDDTNDDHQKMTISDYRIQAKRLEKRVCIPTYKGVESVFSYSVCSAHLILTFVLEVRGSTESYLLNAGKFDKLYYYLSKYCNKAASSSNQTSVLQLASQHATHYTMMATRVSQQ